MPYWHKKALDTVSDGISPAVNVRSSTVINAEAF